MSSPMSTPTSTLSPQASASQLSYRKLAPLPVRSKGRSSKPEKSRVLSNSIDSLSHNSSSEIQPGKQHEIFTFRYLHNATPRPSPEPEEISHSTSPDTQTSLGYSSLPNLSTPDCEGLQPLHTLFSDEKTTNRTETDDPESLISMSSEPRSDWTFDGTAGIIVPRLRFPGQDLSPGQALHQRSVSDTSVVSNKSEVLDSYDVGNEQAPLEPFFSVCFQTALKNGLNIARDTVTAIENCIGESEPVADLERLLQDAKNLSTFQSSDKRTIAVLGDSGEGKSSLINALLHFPEIAKTGDNGAACTSVVTEYRQKKAVQTEPITIEVEYLSMPEIEELIKELLWNYRQVLLPGIEDDQVDSKDYARYQRESEQAWSALKAGFKHRQGFNKSLISHMSEEGLARATDQLLQWAQELEWPEGGNSGMWKSTANTAEECCAKTSVFMQDRFWPFTKIIRVYLSSQVLKTGVVLADLPGLQDTNLARVRSTQMYLLNCDHIFIVAKISRAITDQSLKSSLYTVLARHAPLEWEEAAGQSFRIAVVCTQSEDIKQVTARREFCGPDKIIPSEVMEQLDIDIQSAKLSGNRDLKKRLKRKQELLLVKARNSFVKEGLQKAYASKVPGGKLDVFCVSNTTYEKYSKKGNSEMVIASGIPELRQFCHTITAGAQLLEAKHLLQSTLSSLLNSAELWVGSSPAGQEEDNPLDVSIYEALQQARTETSKSIEISRTEFCGTVREVLLTLLEEGQNDDWERAAISKGQEWHKWHWSQYNAWCINSGNHWTEKRGSVNWNADLIWKMKMELGYQWDLLEDEIPTIFKQLLDSMNHCLANLQSEIREQRFAPALVDGIDFRSRDVEYKFRRTQQEFMGEFTKIRKFASEPNETSYIFSEMTPAYRSAASQSGGGKAARQRAIVQERIANGTLFPLISSKVQSSIEDLVKRTFHGLQDTMTAVLDLIGHDIDMAVDASPQLTIGSGKEKDPEGEERMEVFLAEIEGLRGKHEDLLASIAEL